MWTVWAAGVSCKSLASFSAVPAALAILSSGQAQLIACSADGGLCIHRQDDHGACPLGFFQMHSVRIICVTEPQIHLSFPQVSESELKCCTIVEGQGW